MRKSLISVGIAAKGGNYKRCHNLKKKNMNYSLDSRKGEVAQ